MTEDSSILLLGHRGHLGRALLMAAGPRAEVIEGGRESFDLSRAGVRPVSCLWPGENGLSLAEAEARLCWLQGELRTGQVDPALVHAGLDTIGRTIALAKSPVVINCAGYTNVDRAELEPDLVMAVNGAGAGAVARACAQTGKRLVQVSTDYVFKGDRQTPYHENHATGPINLYGKSKLLGEELVKKELPGALIVRSAWLFGPGKQSFVDKIIQKARVGESLRVVSGQTGSPTYTIDLARALLELADRKVSGLLHVVNSGQANRLELARQALVLAGLDPDMVRPVKSDRLQGEARRPAYSVLQSGRFARLTGGPLPSWLDGLRRHIHSMEESV